MTKPRKQANTPKGKPTRRMKMFPDESDAVIVKKGSARGSIVNYCPPRQPISDESARRVERARRDLGKLGVHLNLGAGAMKKPDQPVSVIFHVFSPTTVSQ